MVDQTEGITALLNTSCYVLHGYTSNELVHSSPIPIISLQSARAASTLTEMLRPFAATYIPSVDLSINHSASKSSSVTAEALLDTGINLNRECAHLLSALFPSNEKGESSHDVTAIIFQNRSFAHFFQSISIATKYMQLYTGAIAEQIDPWPLDEPLTAENQPSPSP